MLCRGRWAPPDTASLPSRSSRRHLFAFVETGDDAGGDLALLIALRPHVGRREVPDRCVEIDVRREPQAARFEEEPRIFVGPFRTKSAKLEPRGTHGLVHLRRDDQTPSPA